VSEEIAGDAEVFKREWAELIGLYRIVASDSAAAQHAREVLGAKLTKHRLRVAIPDLMRMQPGDVLDRLAPRYLLKPVRVPGDDRFGPMVTAETADDLAEIMREMRDDPRLSATMTGSGYLAWSVAR
jgi:hypothetical protein